MFKIKLIQVSIVEKAHCVKDEWMTIVILIEHQFVGKIFNESQIYILALSL